MDEAVLDNSTSAQAAMATTDASAIKTDHDRRWLLIGAVIITGLVLALFWDFFHRQFRWAVEQPADWGHTLAIPFIAGYFVWMRREDLFAKPFRTTWVGLVPILVGVGFYMLAMFGPRAMFHHNLHGFGVAVTLFGIVVLFFGLRGAALLLFPLAYLVVFGQTISHALLERVTYGLQDVTARGSNVALRLFGTDVSRVGNTLYVFDGATGKQHPLNIAEACSGMRMVMAFLALGVAMAYTGLNRMWQRVLLVLCAVPTAIFVNILRVCTLAYLSFHNTDFTAGDFHTFIGMIWLFPAFLVYLGLMWIIRNLVTDAPKEPTAEGSA